MSSEVYIEEMRPAGTEVESSVDLYRAIFTHSSEPIAIISLEGFYLEQNAAHAQLLGYTDAELKNKTPAIHLGEEVFGQIAHELAEKGEYRGEAISKTKAGEIRYIELSAFAMRDDLDA